jgi:hypothetical protein
MMASMDVAVKKIPSAARRIEILYRSERENEICGFRRACGRGKVLPERTRIFPC